MTPLYIIIELSGKATLYYRGVAQFGSFEDERSQCEIKRIRKGAAVDKRDTAVSSRRAPQE